MTNKSISTLEEAEHLLTYTRSAERGIISRLSLELHAALEGLYRVYVNIGEDTDGARNAKELFGPWVGFDPAIHVPSLVADFRKMMEEDYDTDVTNAFDQGRTSVIEYALQHVENEPEHLAGYIDQHVVGVGGSQIPNPYKEA